MSFVTQNRSLSIKNSCDVLVAGGGIAGIAAALAAARTSKFMGTSKRVVLVERECQLGGLATLGLVTIFLPLCDGMGRQVSFGLAEELLRLSIKHGAEASYPDAWLENKSLAEKAKQRFLVQYNPHIFAMEVEQLLLDEGVEIIYHSQICDTIVKDKNITHVVIEGKSGAHAIAVDTVVDATGDADICAQSSEKTQLFGCKNYLAAWYYSASGDLHMHGFYGDPKVKRFDGINDISEMVCLSHKAMLDHILAKRGDNPSYVPVTTPTIPQVRMTRRLDGVSTLDDCDIEKSFDDSIGIISDWRKSGPVYEIPASTLYGHRINNLITAGRCISVTEGMWDISRVIPACAVTGEAAGTAAVMTKNFASMDIRALQNELVRKNVVIKLQSL